MDWKSVDEMAASFAFLEELGLCFESEGDKKEFIEGGFVEQMGHFHLAENVPEYYQSELVLRPL